MIFCENYSIQFSIPEQMLQIYHRLCVLLYFFPQFLFFSIQIFIHVYKLYIVHFFIGLGKHLNKHLLTYSNYSVRTMAPRSYCMHTSSSSSPLEHIMPIYSYTFAICATAANVYGRVSTRSFRSVRYHIVMAFFSLPLLWLNECSMFNCVCKY